MKNLKGSVILSKSMKQIAGHCLCSKIFAPLDVRYTWQSVSDN